MRRDPHQRPSGTVRAGSVGCSEARLVVDGHGARASGVIGMGSRPTAGEPGVLTACRDIHPAKGGRITAAAARAARSMTRRDLHGVLAAAKKDVHAGLTALQIVRQDRDSMSRLLNHAGAGLVPLHSVRGPCSRRTGDRHFMRRLETLAAILAAMPAGRRVRAESERLTDVNRDGAALDLIAEQIAAGFSPRNGARPVSISYRTAPADQTSLRASTASPRVCSGDM